MCNGKIRLVFIFISLIRRSTEHIRLSLLERTMSDKSRYDGVSLFGVINTNIPLAGLTRATLAQELGVSYNAYYMWEKGNKIPFKYISQIAKILGIDPIYARNLALKTYTPGVFEEDERLRRFGELTRNEGEFLEILRNSGKHNPRMNEEQKKKFAEFVASLDDDKPTNFYDKQLKPGRRSTKDKDIERLTPETPTTKPEN